MIKLGRALLNAKAALFVRLPCGTVSSSSVIVPRHAYQTLSKPPSFEVTRFTKEAKLGTEDLIHRDIRNASTATDLLTIVEKYHAIMNNRHLLAAFGILADKVQAGGVLPQEVTTSPSFASLSKQTLSRMRFNDPSDCVRLLRATAQLKIPASSPLTQSICQMLQASLNHLSLKQLIFVHFLIGRIEEQTFLTESLRTTIPILFQEKYTQISGAKLDDCLSALRFALSVNCNRQILDYISSAVQSHRENLSIEDAMKLIITLSFVKDNGTDSLDSPAFRELLDSFMKIITTDIHKLKEKQIQTLLGVLKFTGFCREVHDYFWLRAAEEKWTLSRVAAVAYASKSQCYFTVENAKLVRDLIIEEENEIDKSDTIPLQTLSHFIAFLATRGDFAGPEKPTSEMTDDELCTRRAATILGSFKNAARLGSFKRVWIDFLRDLAVAGTFPMDQLEVLFGYEFQQSLVKRDRPSSDLITLLNIEQLVRLRFGEEGSAHLRIDPALRPQLLRVSEGSSIECKAFQTELGVALGGDQFFARGVITPLGTRADYLVVMRQGDYPMAISHHHQKNTSELLKGFPLDSKVVTLVLANEANYLPCSEMPTVDFSIRVELLRAQKMCPVVINVDLWMALKKHERIPSLMRDLKAALDVGHVYADMEIHAV